MLFVMQVWTYFWQAVLTLLMATMLALILIFLGGCLTTFWNGIWDNVSKSKDNK